jgi:hypothetical protein
MKTLKASLLAFFVGVVLSVVPISVYAACDKTLVFEGTTCELTGESCDANVCVCSYNCGPVT